MMARASNLVPRAAKDWSPIKQLSRSSIVFNKAGMVVRIRWSKTIQFQQRVLEIPVFSIKNSILCPMAAMKRVLNCSRAGPNGPLLGIADDKPFTYNMLQSRLKKTVKKLGLKKARYSSHSLRRGGVVWAQRNGVKESLIKLYGDWSSDAYKKYLQFPHEMRVVVGHKMTHRLQNFKNLF